MSLILKIVYHLTLRRHSDSHPCGQWCTGAPVLCTCCSFRPKHPSWNTQVQLEDHLCRETFPGHPAHSTPAPCCIPLIALIIFKTDVCLLVYYFFSPTYIFWEKKSWLFCLLLYPSAEKSTAHNRYLIAIEWTNRLPAEVVAYTALKPPWSSLASLSLVFLPILWLCGFRMNKYEMGELDHYSCVGFTNFTYIKPYEKAGAE